MDERTIKILEFDKIRELLSAFGVSRRAKEAIREIEPVTDYDEAVRLQRLTAEAYDAVNKYLLSPIVEFDETSGILDKAKVGAMLQMGELLKVARLIRAARIAKRSIEGTGEDIALLKEITMNIFVNEGLEKSISESIAGENEMRDDASDKLRTIRRKISALNNKLKDKLNSYTRAGSLSKYLQDNIVTVRGGRFVLPVKSECRSQVPGLIHDSSSSGSTVFIEPFAIVDMNNELRSLQSEEAAEIERILLQLSGEVASSYDMLTRCEEACTALDVIFAKNAFSQKIKGTAPTLNNRGYLNLIRSRHPLIDADRVVPVTLTLGGDYRILLITGPNTGGKTVCLKTVGLFTLMACAGLRLPCDEGSEIAVFDNVFCDIGDEQSIAQSLSTFSSHILNIVRITDRLTPNSLVLLDELGGGTDPVEGASLAVGILKYLELMRAKGVVTTHYPELKEYALLSSDIMNGCMQFDDATLRPTFKLMIGIPGVSNALKIARSLGLNDYILRKAQENLKDEKVQFETVLHNAEEAKSRALAELEQIEREKQELDKERAELERDRQRVAEKLERIAGNARLETKRLVSSAMERADELIDEIKKRLKEADEQALLEAHRARKKLENLMYEAEEADLPAGEPVKRENLRVGQKVIVTSLRAEGIVTALPDKKNEVEVQIGSLRSKARIIDLLFPLKKEVKKPVSPPPIRPKRTEEAVPVTEEIRVLGLTVAEAVEVIEPYLISASGQILKIIHGKGTGALSRGIHQYLRQSPLVASYRFGRYGEGDNGVTFVEIK